MFMLHSNIAILQYMYSRTVDPDPHSFSLLDQDPGDEKQKKQKNRKNARQMHGNHYNFIKF